MPSANYIFASYAHNDLAAVEPVLKALNDAIGRRGLAVAIWFNPDELQPGQDWTETITRALQECIGLLLFLSPSSLDSASVGAQLLVALEKPDNLIIPILLQPAAVVPSRLANRQIFDLSDYKRDANEPSLQTAAERIVDLIEEYLERDNVVPPVRGNAAQAFAASIAGETREAQQKDPAAAVPNSVFVVHGHDTKTRDQVNAYLARIGIEGVVLAKIAGPAQSLLQKFLKTSVKARFAIVILTPDDFGVSRRQFESAGVGERALQFRARQNVILELGFFYGQLGWENVFVIFHSAEVFPNFERPSDLEGVVFVEMDETGEWQQVLTNNLLAAGFEIKSQP